MAEAQRSSHFSKVLRAMLKLVLFVLIIFAGMQVYRHFVATRTKPTRKQSEQKALLVETVAARPSEEKVQIVTMGMVIPARSVSVFPEVSGKIVYQDKRLIPGGRFKQGEVLVRIDARDYDLAIKQQQASVAQAELNLAQERGQKVVAEREWKRMKGQFEPTEEGKKLALRDIQLKNAQAALAAAKSSLRLAQLRRSRTVIRAPFNVLVVEEFVDPGQVVSNASKIATLVGTDVFWVRVSIPVDRLSWVAIPGMNGTAGAVAAVSWELGPLLLLKRTGRVIKLLPDLDPKGKMARLLVAVDQPLDFDPQRGPSLPLLLGSHVIVTIEGPKLQNIVSLPRRALRDQKQIWVKNGDSKLEIRSVEVVWAKDTDVLVRGDLRPLEQVVVSRIATPVAGMRLRSVAEAAASKPARAASKRDREPVEPPRSKRGIGE